MDFRSNTISNIKQAIDIRNIVSDYISLDSHHKANCPFHKDHNPSFVVFPDEQQFHCFGCGAHGDIFDFVEGMEGCSFLEALKKLAFKAGVPFPNDSATVERLEQERSIRNVLRETAAFYNRSMPDRVKRYLIEDRGLTEDSISRFMLGYADGGLARHLIEECCLDGDLCVEAGVLVRNGDGYRDFFNRRVILPFISKGQVVHMTGRSFDGGEPKYLHLKKPMNFLYNEDACRHASPVIAEGPFDAILLAQAGHPAVAVVGTHLKDEHLEKFSRCEKVFVCLDGDDAGKKGALDIASKLGSRARLVILPDGMDPNEYLLAFTPDDFERLKNEARDSIEYQILQIPPDIKRLDLHDRLEPILGQLATMDRVRADAYFSDIIMPRFKLRKEELAGYRAEMKTARKASHSAVPGKVKPEYSASFDNLVDIVEHEGRLAFLVKEDRDLRICSEYEINGKILAPPPVDSFPFMSVSGTEVLNAYGHYSYGDADREVDANLFRDLAGYHKSISEMPDDRYYDIIALWVMHTYLLEVFEYTPYLGLYAPPECGKTRTGKGICAVCYRGYRTESLRDASLIRLASNCRATIFFDVVDLSGTTMNEGSNDIITGRFEKGSKIARVMYPDRGPFEDTVYFDIFGPTIFATNEALSKIIETRTLQINMPESEKAFESSTREKDGKALKVRLTAFRARHMGEELMDIPKPATGRFGDILRPLIQIAYLFTYDVVRFTSFMYELDLEKGEERADTVEATVLRAVWGLQDKIQNDAIPVRSITEKVNNLLGLPSHRCYSPQRIGSICRSLTFRKKKTREGNSAILFDEKLIMRLAKKYSLLDYFEDAA